MSSTVSSPIIVELRSQYAYDGLVMSDDTYGEQGADSAAAFTIDGCVFVSCERAPRGKWRIDSTDGSGCPIPVSAYRYRFSTLANAVEYVAKKSNVTVRHVDSWI